MQSLSVSLEQRSYPIHIGLPQPSELGLALRCLAPPPSSVLIVHDEKLAAFSNRVASDMAEAVPHVSMVSVASGEASKCVAQLARLWSCMLANKIDRKGVIVAIGGGVIGDLAGFASATWNRGVRFVQIPTTLLAMVDSSVGGKTGINLPEAKNVIGAFWQPSLVWMDLAALETLPSREFQSGLAEVLKYGVIMDDDFFEYLESHADRILARDPESLTAIVRRSCELKAEVVADDERETTGRRAILNYGHTFGHAIEALTEYGALLHGEAIAIGMTMAGQLAVDLGRWSTQDLQRQTLLLHRFALPTQLPASFASDMTPQSFLSAMMLDKKTEYGRLNLILPARLGQVEIVGDAPAVAIEGVLCSAIESSKR